VSVLRRVPRLSSQELEHVGVVPGGLLALGTHAGFGRLVPADDVERDLAQEGQVACCGAVAHAAVVLAKRHIQHPMQGVLNGLIANDKFCLMRAVRLRLSWRRARGRLRADRPQPPDEVTHQGGEHGTAAAQLACSADGRASGNGPAALAPSLSAPPAVGGCNPARADGGAGTLDPAAGTPCA